MVNPKRPPSGPPVGRRKRPPTVIDLEAAEIPPESQASDAAPESSPQSSPAADQPPVEPATPEPPAVQAEAKPAEQVFDHSAFEPPPPEPRVRPEPQPEPDARTTREAASHAPGASRESDPPPASDAGKRGPSWMPQAGAAVAGGAGGLLLVLLLWMFGAFSGGSDAPAGLDGRLATIERQLTAIAARPAPATIEPKVFDEIAGRLTKLEAAQAAPRAPVTDPVVLSRLTAAENAAKSQSDNLAAMSRRAEAAETALRDSNAKIAALSSALTDLQTRAKETAAGSDRGSRLALAAFALRAMVERGEPFTAELAVVKPLSADTTAVAALEPFAAAGVPSQSVLGRELAALVRPMMRAAGETPRGGGFLDKLQANAEKLVRIRPVDDASGDDRGAVLARIEERAMQSNIAGALAELAKLPPAARAPAQTWIAKAEARNKAIEASRKLAAESVAALKAAP